MNTKQKTERPVYPFTAIIGQEEMKLALLLNVIDPKIGGVMIMGDRGTGKSTVVRSLTDILPEIKVIKDDPYNTSPQKLERYASGDYSGQKQQTRRDAQRSSVQAQETDSMKTPMIDLPLGATEDRVCGTIDMEKALTKGVKAFEPGLLAKANRGILYVDEINLLDDHLVDLLLDSAASGWNTVEREGISVRHPAQFILVGSGNPEEGELRPQLLDRFGMHAQVKTVTNPAKRVSIVERRALFDKDPNVLRALCEKQLTFTRKQILEAQKSCESIVLDRELQKKISDLCGELNIDGLRGDIVVNRAAKALAAFNGSKQVEIHDIAMVITLCLRHRLRKDPLETMDSGDVVAETFEQIFDYPSIADIKSFFS